MVVTQSCLVTDSATPQTVCSPPGSSIHGILQTRILEWVAIPFSRESSWPRDQTRVSCIRGGFYHLSPGEDHTSCFHLEILTWHPTLYFGADPTAAKWLLVWLVYLQPPAGPRAQGGQIFLCCSGWCCAPQDSPPAMVYSEVKVAQSCPTLCDPIHYSPPGSSVHGILQTRILEWVAIPFSRGSSWPRNQTQVSCIASRFFTKSPEKPKIFCTVVKKNIWN